MPSERQFRDKYAGRLPERICCPNSVQLVTLKNGQIRLSEITRDGPTDRWTDMTSYKDA